MKRYQKWLRDSIDDALEAFDEGPKVDRRPEELIGEDPYDDDEKMKPNKRTRFGGEEVRAFDPEQAGVGDLEIPEMSVPDADWNVSEYQPSEAEDDDMGEAPEMGDAQSIPRHSMRGSQSDTWRNCSRTPTTHHNHSLVVTTTTSKQHVTYLLVGRAWRSSHMFA